MNPREMELVPIPRIVLTVASAVMVATIIGLFSFILSISSRLAVAESQLTEIPPPEVTFRLTDHERRLAALERLNSDRGNE